MEKPKNQLPRLTEFAEKFMGVPLQDYQRRLLEWLENKTPEQIKDEIHRALWGREKVIPKGVYRGKFRVVSREEQEGNKAYMIIIDELTSIQ